MLTIGELALFMEKQAAHARHGLLEVTHHLMKAVATDAKALIGHELDRWPPLADGTVAEKLLLGYVGHISATDPLLRTGDMRETIKHHAELTATGAEGVVGSGSKIALDQEMGTKHIPPRPFLAEAMAQIEPKARHEIELFGAALLRPPIV